MTLHVGRLQRISERTAERIDTGVNIGKAFSCTLRRETPSGPRDKDVFSAVSADVESLALASLWEHLGNKAR